MMKKLDILVVDDDRDNANSMGELFELEGHRVHVVYSGEEAIAAYHQANYDVSFLDVMMPGMNGVESFLAIRKLRPNANVFMMSGYSVEDLLKQAVDKGALGLLTKPVPPEAVLEMVQSVGPNGLVVAQGQGPAFTRALCSGLEMSGAKFEVIPAARNLDQANMGNVMIMDSREKLIDSVCHYSRLRKIHEMPATVILAQPSIGRFDSEGLDDVIVTGILNKPFDPERLIGKLNQIAA
ncbi:MAG TPA: response regulator [Aestuariivirga sp.]